MTRSIADRIDKLEKEKERLKERSARASLKILKKILKIGTPKEQIEIWDSDSCHYRKKQQPKKYELGNFGDDDISSGHGTYDSSYLYVRGKSLWVRSSSGYVDFHGGRETSRDERRAYPSLDLVKSYDLDSEELEEILKELKKSPKGVDSTGENGRLF